jgi:hypothetical protein
VRALAQLEMLQLWETGRPLHPLDQGVLAVATAFPDAADVADWPLGRRNRALAELRAALFGPALRGWTTCRHCPEQLEFEVDGRALAEGPEPEAEVVAGARRYRLPTSRDLAAVAGAADAQAAARALLDRCRAPEASPGGETDIEVEAVGERMATADPLAEILLRFDCPNCGAAYDEALDLASFLWAELDARALNLLAQVHQLARAYGWSEAEILALSPARREAYIEMAGA